MKQRLPDTTLIEVVMRKKMTIFEYMEMRKNAIKKGWTCQGYQLDFYTVDNLKNKI